MNLKQSYPLLSRRLLIGGAGVVFAMGALVPFLQGQKESESTASPATLSSPFTNSAPIAVFTTNEMRDPFLPPGYRKPPPEGSIARVKIELEVTGISFIDGIPLATLKTGEAVEIGETYKYRGGKDGSIVVEYQVINITDDLVTILFNGEEQSFKLESLDLERYKEKE
jgi:hypothetical protein